MYNITTALNLYGVAFIGIVILIIAAIIYTFVTDKKQSEEWADFVMESRGLNKLFKKEGF